MVHRKFIPGRGSRSLTRALALLPLMFIALSTFGQDASSGSLADGTIPPLTEDEGLSKATLIGYIASGVAFILMIAGAWWLTGRKSPKEEESAPAHTPGMRISSAHTNDPYMRRKVIKKTN